MADFNSICVYAAGSLVIALHLRRRKSRNHCQKKRLWLIRHGESTFNAAMDAYFESNPDIKKAQEQNPSEWWENGEHYDPQTPDAPLTEKGVAQAEQLASKLNGCPIQLVCVSPLTRALQTYTLVFQNMAHLPVLVCPRLSERVNSSCDVGSPPSHLHDRFPSLGFGKLAKDWWQHRSFRSPSAPSSLDPPKKMEPLPDFQQRISSFEAWLRGRPEKDICLVCHAVVIHAIIGQWVANCELNIVEFGVDGCTISPLEAP